MKMTAEIGFLFIAHFSVLRTLVRNIELSSDIAMKTKHKTQALHLPLFIFCLDIWLKYGTKYSLFFS